MSDSTPAEWTRNYCIEGGKIAFINLSPDANICGRHARIRCDISKNKDEKCFKLRQFGGCNMEIWRCNYFYGDYYDSEQFAIYLMIFRGWRMEAFFDD